MRRRLTVKRTYKFKNSLFNNGIEFINQLNEWGQSGTPFVFMVDYAKLKPLAWPINQIDNELITFNFNGFTNKASNNKRRISEDFSFSKTPIPFEEYRIKFDLVVKELKAGNSFLINLSVPTAIQTNLSLIEIFDRSVAPYRLRYQNDFVCFSPEIFIKIHKNKIASFPMKGTIDAAIPNAANQILNDTKEAAEHATIVDLIRNDLSMICDKVWVEKYRYIDKLQTNQKELLQVSSEISGILADELVGNFGDIIWNLLPAGSICGAPKPSTLNIINTVEKYDRGYYTGVMGYFDGTHFESAVMIRFIENQNEQLVFKSGGGITAQSNVQSEYQEIIDKVYLPFNYVPEPMH